MYLGLKCNARSVTNASQPIPSEKSQGSEVELGGAEHRCFSGETRKAKSPQSQMNSLIGFSREKANAIK